MREVPAWMRIRALERNRLPLLHGDGARPVSLRPYHSFLLKRTAKDEPAGDSRWRKDEYPPQVAG